MLQTEICNVLEVNAYASTARVLVA